MLPPSIELFLFWFLKIKLCPFRGKNSLFYVDDNCRICSTVFLICKIKFFLLIINEKMQGLYLPTCECQKKVPEMSTMKSYWKYDLVGIGHWFTYDTPLNQGVSLCSIPCQCISSQLPKSLSFSHQRLPDRVDPPKQLFHYFYLHIDSIRGGHLFGHKFFRIAFVTSTFS